MDVFIESELIKNEKKMAFYYLHLVACISYFAVFLNFRRPAKILNFIFIEYSWILSSLKCLCVFFFCSLIFPSKSPSKYFQLIVYDVGFKLWTLTD